MKQTAKEKEYTEKIKALRQEIEEKLEEQLPSEMLEGKSGTSVQQIAASDVTDPNHAKRVIEAILFAATKPLTAAEIKKVMKSISVPQIESIIRELKEQYQKGEQSFEIIEIANGYEMATKKDYAPWIMKIELQKKVRQVTQSALETLAILAYKQPITRAEIEELRGVDVSAVLSTLMEKGLIKIVGKKEVPGRPFLYGTTDKFLNHFGLKSLQNLPSIEEIRNLVEGSIKKEELLGRPQIVKIPTAPEEESKKEEENEEGSKEENEPGSDTQ